MSQPNQYHYFTHPDHPGLHAAVEGAFIPNLLKLAGFEPLSEKQAKEFFSAAAVEDAERRADENANEQSEPAPAPG